MTFRDRYSFDIDPTIPSVDCFSVLATTSDQCTWWLEAGQDGKLKFLAHFTEPRGQLYLADRLHAETLVDSSEYYEYVVRLLRRAADSVPSVIDLVKPESIPGFCKKPYGVYHEQGWKTTSERALPLPPPVWAPEARVWDISEGIYMMMPTNTIRLVDPTQYYAFNTAFTSKPAAVFGSLLVFEYEPKFIERFEHGAFVRPYATSELFPCILANDPDTGEEEYMEGYTYRSPTCPNAGEFGVVSHKDYGDFHLDKNWETLVLMPGLEYPFK